MNSYTDEQIKQLVDRVAWLEEEQERQEKLNATIREAFRQVMDVLRTIKDMSS
jgi:uncharacterized protein (UPF0335 family)